MNDEIPLSDQPVREQLPFGTLGRLAAEAEGLADWPDHPQGVRPPHHRISEGANEPWRILQALQGADEVLWLAQPGDNTPPFYKRSRL